MNGFLTVRGCGKDYEILELELLEAFSRFSIYDYITPLNLAEAEASFFEFGESPVFEYRGDSGELDGLEKWVRGLPLSRKDGCWPFLVRAREMFLNEVQIAKSVGTDLFERLTLRHTPLPSDRELRLALRVLGKTSLGPGPDESEKTVLDSAAVAKRFAEEFAGLGMEGWDVVVGPSVAKARVETSRKRVVVKGGEWFSESEVKRLVAHEIWGHALRGENGSRQPARVLGTQYLGGAVTDEGVSLHLEIAAGVWRGPLRSARHVLAVSAARDASFAKVYAAIRKYAHTDREAFLQTVRVKRGLEDTSKPGGWTKDVIYFRGLLEVKEFFSKAGYLDVECLYAGKLSLADCEEVRRKMREGLLRAPEALPPPLVRGRYRASLKTMRAALADASL